MNINKYIKTLLGLLTVIITRSAVAQVTYPNYVQTDMVKASGATSDSLMYSLAPQYRQTTRAYVDGLGRTIQTIAVQASPLQNDIIAPVAYDNLGRQTVAYLPYAGKSTDTMGRYRTNALTTAQAAFYNNTSQYLIPLDTAAHIRQVFENSPLQRMLQTGMAGTGYQPGDGGTQHYKTLSYRPNNSTADGSIYMTGSAGIFSTSSYYANNMLWVTDGVNEDGRETLIFKDLAGRTIMKRQKTSSVSEPNLDTYYIYNNAGTISYIVPPKAVHLIITSGYTLTSAPVANLIYAYSYNNLGLVYAKTIPDKGTTFIIYDPLNRPLLMRDSNMYAKHQWYYIKYDVKGRPAATGIFTNPGHTTYSSMLSYVSTTYGTTYWYESRTTSSTYRYYTNNVFPTTGLTPMSYSYYDNYDLNDDGAADYAYQSQGLTGEAAQTTDSLKGLPTMSAAITIGPGIATPFYIMTATFYDKYGHVIQVRSDNQLYTSGGLTDSRTIVPDFTGKPLQSKVKVVSGTAAGTTNSVTTTYNYDAGNRRIASLDQVYNAQPSKRIAAYVYNEAGQLTAKKLDSLGMAFLQKIDYRYNIRGQLTSVNNSTLTSDGGITNNDTNDLFGMQLLYDQTDPHLATDTASYSGMLTAVKWMSRDGNNNLTNERSYVYSYDKLGRYDRANYAERASGGGTSSFTLNPDGFDENGIGYDEAGNITRLKRNTSGGVGATSYTQADNLTYTYDGTRPNQLNSIADAGSSTLGFITPNGTGGTYTYDLDGNLTYDPYKGLTLKYNSINRADSIVQASGAYMTYTYDAAGTVLRKQVYSSSTTLSSQTDYIGGFVYTTQSSATTLTYITNPEGRLMNTGGATPSLTPEYVITDQQGNARFSFEDNGTSLVIRQENSYYGFGETFTSSTVAIPATANKNLYNGGNEWQNDFSNMPDYQQTFNRNYDAETGRFIAVDPMPESAESMNVYQYAGDNPIMMNDPGGDKSSAGNEYGSNHATVGFSGGGGSAFAWSDYLNDEADAEMAGFEADNADYAIGAGYLNDDGGGGSDGGGVNNSSFWSTLQLFGTGVASALKNSSDINEMSFSGNLIRATIDGINNSQSGQLTYITENNDGSTTTITTALSSNNNTNESTINYLQQATFTPYNDQSFQRRRIVVGFTDPGDLGTSDFQWIQVYSRNGADYQIDNPQGSFIFYYTGSNLANHSGEYTDDNGNQYGFTDYLSDAPGFKPNEIGTFSSNSTVVGFNSNGTIFPIESYSVQLNYNANGNVTGTLNLNTPTSSYINQIIQGYNFYYHQ